MGTPRFKQQEGNSSFRSSPEEEFFLLSCFAMKVKLAEQEKNNNNDLLASSNKEEFEMANKIDERELFKLCQEQKIPFYLWHDWIRDEFEKHIKGSK